MTNPVTHLAIVADHGIIVSADADGTLRLIELEDGSLHSEVRIAVAGVPTRAGAIAPRGHQLLVGTVEGRILLYHIGQ